MGKKQVEAQRVLDLEAQNAEYAATILNFETDLAVRIHTALAEAALVDKTRRHAQEDIATLAEKKRVAELEWIASVWPDGEIPPPTVLRPYFISSEEDRNLQKVRLEKQQKKDKMADEIRSHVSAASLWLPLDDEYGSTYYYNEGTGESLWEAPLEMLYEPPVGWDFIKATWKEKWGPEGNEDEDSRINIALQIAKKDFNQESEEDDDDDDPEYNSEDEDDNEGDPIQLRIEMEALLSEENDHVAKLEKLKDSQRELMHTMNIALQRVKDADSEEREASAARQRKMAQAERAVFLKSVASARADAEALMFYASSTNSTDVAIMQRVEEAKEWLEAHPIESGAALEEETPPTFSRPPLAYALSSVEEVRFKNQTEREKTYGIEMELTLEKIDTIEQRVATRHDVLCESFAANTEEWSSFATTLEERKNTALRKIKHRKSLLGETRHIKARPRAPSFSCAIEDFDPIKFFTTLLPGYVQSENSAREEAERGNRRRSSGRSRSISPSGRSTGRSGRSTGRSGRSTGRSDGSGRSGSETDNDSDHNDDDDDVDDEDEEDAAVSHTIIDWVFRRPSWTPLDPNKKLPVAESVPELLFSVSSMTAENPAQIEFITKHRQLERSRRSSLMALFDVGLQAWKKDECDRVSHKETLQNEISLLQRQVSKIITDLKLYVPQVSFLQDIESHQKESRDRHWDIAADIKLQQVKQSLEQTAGQEALMELIQSVAEVRRRYALAEQLPLQATNPVQKLALEKRSKLQLVELTKELNSTILAMEVEKERNEKLKGTDLLATHLHLCRLEEELEKQEETTPLVADHLDVMKATHVLHGTLYDDDLLHEPTSEQTVQYTSLLSQLFLSRSFLHLLLLRDKRWSNKLQHLRTSAQDIVDGPHNDQVSFLDTTERARIQERIVSLQHQLQLQQTTSQDSAHAAGAAREVLENEMTRMRKNMLAVQSTFTITNTASHDTSIDIITHLKTTIVDQEKAALIFKNTSDTELHDVRKNYQNERENSEEIISNLRIDIARKTEWIKALRSELNGMGLTNEQLVKSYKALEKRRADEVLNLTCRLNALMEKAHGLQMWNDSMQDTVSLLTATVATKELERTELQEQHRVDTRALRCEIWKHRITATNILTSVRDLFLFFAQGLATLSGSSEEVNDTLRDNAALPVLAALCRNPRFEIQRLAARALGELNWNRNTMPRLIGWNVQREWKTWVTLHSTFEIEKMKKEAKEFDQVPEEDDNEMHHLATGHLEKKRSILETTRTIASRFNWAFRPAKKEETPHARNQALIGQNDDILDVLVTLCAVCDWEVQRRASNALAVTSLLSSNAVRMGRREQLVAVLITMLQCDDAEVRSNASTALGNLAYNNFKNQNRIREGDGIRHLLALLGKTTGQEKEADAVILPMDSDTVICATSALANVVWKNETNAILLGHLGGIYSLVELCHSHVIVNVVDPSVVEAIQANASECLVNIMEANDDTNLNIIIKKGVEPFVLMCASLNKVVRCHGALVLGNLAQNDTIRAVIGQKGGIEALFRLASRKEEDARINAMWAISNLTWNRANQDRAGVHLRQLMDDLCCDCQNTGWLAVQEQATSALANILFYNASNRKKLAEKNTWLQKLLQLCKHESLLLVQHALRAVAAAAYEDIIAERLPLYGALALLVGYTSHTDMIIVLQSTNAILNLCVYKPNRPLLVDNGGLERLVELAALTNSFEIRNSAEKALELLADVPEVEELQASKKRMWTFEEMITICSTSEDIIVVGMAAEDMAETLFREKSTEVKSLHVVNRQQQGMQGLFTAMKRHPTPTVLLPALAALRNLTHYNKKLQDKLAKNNGIAIVVTILQNHSTEVDTVHAALAALVNFVLEHERNSREIIANGLEILLEIAQDRTGNEDTAINSKLARDILHIIGPYNWILCPTCLSKQHGGKQCSQCGHVIFK